MGLNKARQQQSGKGNKPPRAWIHGSLLFPEQARLPQEIAAVAAEISRIMDVLVGSGAAVRRQLEGRLSEATDATIPIEEWMGRVVTGDEKA